MTTHVLFVDDHAREHDRYAAHLAGTGAVAVCCADGAEALKLIENGEPPIVAAVVLWELVGSIGGVELLTLLRRTAPGLPLLVVSGLLDVSRAARARALGAVDFLLKPVGRERLREAIRAALGETASSPLVVALRARLTGEAPAFLAMLDRLAPLIAEPGATVLLVGENGTGKELLAQAVHHLGAVDKRALVSINVASIPNTLLEAELFGHEAGAFTDARERRAGVFEQSGSGTLFLDEIGELESPLQAKLLRVIQERQFRRVGGKEDLRFAARLVCATNRDLLREKESGRFREDLYYRIAAHEVRLPSLRDRPEDIRKLVEHFVHKYAPGRRVRLAPEVWQLLAGYPFPGNVRELEGLIKDALLKAAGEDLLPYHFPIDVMLRRQGGPEEACEASPNWPAHLFGLPQKQAVAELEMGFDRAYLPRKLDEAGGNITRAAKVAGVDPKTFRRKWEQAGLPPLTGTE